MEEINILGIVMFLYIDPGTGSMLFTIILGLATAALFVIRGFWSKLSLYIAKGKNSKDISTEKKYQYVIYTDSKRYWNVFHPICDEFEKRGISLHYMTQSEDDPFFDMKYEHITGEYIGQGNTAFAKLNFLNADTVISTTPGLDVYQWKRSKSVNRYIHVFHDLSDSTGYEMFGLDYYDEIIMCGSIQEKYIRELECKRNLKAKKLHLCGSVYMDEMKDRLASYGDIARDSDKTTVLLAPSWGPSSILNTLGDKMLSALKNTKYNVVVRPHPQTKVSEVKMLESLMEKFPESENFHWDFSNDNFLVLAKSDIMITDFSSVMCDYALIFNRPYLYSNENFDIAPYDASWLDEIPFRLKRAEIMGKKLIESDLNQLETIIDSVLINDEFAAGRNRVKEILWACQGEATVRTVDCIVGNK